MAKGHRRFFQPRFFLFLLATLILLVGIVVLITTLSKTLENCKLSESLPMDVHTTVAPGDSLIVGTNPMPQEEPSKATPPPLDENAQYTANGSANGISYQLRRNNESTEFSSNPNPNSISFGRADSYSKVQGVLTFGSNHYRNSFAYGQVAITKKTIATRWTKSVSGMGEYFGVNGQPLIIRWSDEVKPTLGIAEAYKTMEDFTEVIYPCADGNIYFYELQSGAETRNPINVGVSLRGTATLDPNGYPMLYVGQGVPQKNERGNLTACVYAIDLIQNRSVKEFIGKDYFCYRNDWTAFTSSPLIADDTLILPGESGVLYLIKLNTQFDAASASILINPGDRIKYRYTAAGYSASDDAGAKWYGFQGSASAFRNYLYLADNGGYLQCIDLNTLKLRFAVDLGGDTDASIAIEEDGNAGTIYLYVATQTDRPDASLPEGMGYSTVRKINGLTGAVVWAQQQPCFVRIGESAFKSGAKGTMHLGSGELSSLALCSFYRCAIPNYDEQGNLKYTMGGMVVAYDKITGEVVWNDIRIQDGAGYLSSPMVMYQQDDAYLVMCDWMGNVTLFDVNAKTAGLALGQNINLGAAIEGTPAAFDNYFVIGTTGKQPDGRMGTPTIVGLRVE